MPIVVTTPSTFTFPPSVIPPTVLAKQSWAGNWVVQLNLVPTHVSTSSAGQDMSRVVFHHRYGMVKNVPDAVPVVTANRNYDDWWIQIVSYIWNGLAWVPVPIWVGRVSSDDAAEYASSTVPAGVQQFVAYGPEQLLRKQMVGSSVHAVPFFSSGGQRLHTIKPIGWVPPMNDPRGSEVGTRSENVHDVKGNGDFVFLYGGTSGWSHWQHIEYLLEVFMSTQTAGGPVWILTGLLAPLAQMWGPIRWRGTQTMFQMLRALIPLDRGLDFVVRPLANDLGFEVNVFAVSPVVYTFAGVTLPANTNLIAIDTGAGQDLSPPPRIVETHDRTYKRIRILGKRIVVGGSLWGSRAPRVARVPEFTIGIPGRIGVDDECDNPTLVKKWDDQIEADYLAGAGVDGTDHDGFRKQDKFQDVYVSFGAPPGWDHNDGTASPWVDDVGQLVADDPATPAEDESIAPFQQTLRQTLPWLPFKHGEDWTDIRLRSTLSRGDQIDVDDHQADYLPPVVWIFDPSTSCFRQAKDIGLGVRPQEFEWGVRLQASPSHLVAREDFKGAGTALSATQGVYDWQEAIATIAWQSDHRYTYYWQAPGATADDEVKDIEVDAELHYLSPNTVVAIPEPPAASAPPTPSSPPIGPPPAPSPIPSIPEQKVILSGDSRRVIRADSDLMGLAMAGAISRYGAGRRRASVNIMGLPLFHGLVGGMLGAVNENGIAHVVNGPITGVTWSLPPNGPVSTSIRAGFAR